MKAKTRPICKALCCGLCTAAHKRLGERIKTAHDRKWHFLSHQRCQRMLPTDNPRTAGPPGQFNPGGVCTI